MEATNNSFMNAALFIKRAEENQTKEFIMKAFKKSNIGTVRDVTFIKKNSNGVAYNGVVVIFEKWNMNKYVESLFDKMAESRDGTTRFYFEPKRYWIVNVHKQQLPECEESIVVKTDLSDKERINQLEATIKSMSAQIYYMQTNNEKNERRMMEYEQRDIQKHLINTELQYQLEMKDIDQIWIEEQYQKEIQQLKNENLCLRASCSLLETDVAKHLKREKILNQEVDDLNDVVKYLENQLEDMSEMLSETSTKNIINPIIESYADSCVR